MSENIQMYFSFIHTSDLIIVMRNVSCSFLLHIKYEKYSRQYLTKASVSSKYRVEPESIKGNDNDFLS